MDIPVGCVPFAAVHRLLVCGVVPKEGILPKGGVCPGVCLDPVRDGVCPGGVPTQRHAPYRGSTPPGQILYQTGVKKGWDLFRNFVCGR